VIVASPLFQSFADFGQRAKVEPRRSPRLRTFTPEVGKKGTRDLSKKGGDKIMKVVSIVPILRAHYSNARPRADSAAGRGRGGFGQLRTRAVDGRPPRWSTDSHIVELARIGTSHRTGVPF
jgi:hypothetical protein